MTHKKSKSCLDPETGELLLEFTSMSAARTEAARVNKREKGELAHAVKCKRCGAFHVRSAPEAFTMEEVFERIIDIKAEQAPYTTFFRGSGCDCRGRDGRPKRLYRTAAEARAAASSRPASLRVYECPETEGYHLTSRLGRFH